MDRSAFIAMCVYIYEAKWALAPVCKLPQEL